MKWNGLFLRHPPLAYGLAVVLVGMALAGSALLWERMAAAPMSLLIVAVAISAWVGGLGPGLLAAALAAGTSIWLTWPLGGLDDLGLGSLLGIGSLLLVTLLVAHLNAARRRAVLALEERDVRLQLVSDQIPAGLWSTDQELRITSIFGASITVPAGIGLDQALGTDDPDHPALVAHRRALAGEHCGYEMNVRGRVFQAHVEPLRDREGMIIGVVGVALDITERKEAEEKLKQAKDLAEAAMRAKDQFLAMLSHELRTPLTPVLAAASALEMQIDLPAEVREDLEMIRRNVELEARLIDDLLDLTRISRRKLELSESVVDVHEVLRRAVEICEDDASESGVDLLVQAAAERHVVRGDPARLQQVFWNLIKNAVKFTPRGGQVRVISANDPQGRLAVDVIDSGIGIRPELLEKVFEPFEQGDETIGRRLGGLGLGLAITRALVRAHEGEISAHSEGRGRGARFRVELNTVSEPAAAPAAAPAGTNGHGRAPVRILLVEDHADTLRILSRLLERSGHHVTCAGGVGEALEAAAAREFDLIVADLGLPDGDGFDLMRRLRPRGPVKAIALSGYGMESDIEKSRAAGFADHLIKPVNLDILQAAIARVSAGEP